MRAEERRQAIWEILRTAEQPVSAGALAATVVAHAIMWAGRVKVVCRLYMTGALGRYLRVQAAHLLTLAACMGATSWVCAQLPGGVFGFAGRVAVAALLPNLLNLACYAWTSDAAYLRQAAAKAVKKLARKGEK